MLAIGRALMMQPRVLVMDEPSEGLAPSILEQLVDHMQRIPRERAGPAHRGANVDLALDMATESRSWATKRRCMVRPSDALRSQPAVLAELVGLAIHHGGIWT